VCGIKVVVSRGGRGPDQVVVVVLGHLAGEHILARQLVATVSNKTLFITSK
jgi:hypothetical protein